VSYNLVTPKERDNTNWLVVIKTKARSTINARGCGTNHGSHILIINNSSHILIIKSNRRGEISHSIILSI